MRIWVLTCSWSAVKLVRALLAGLGWFTSCSEGTAPSTLTPFPKPNHIRMSGIKLKPWFHKSWMNGYGINIVRLFWTTESSHLYNVNISRQRLTVLHGTFEVVQHAVVVHATKNPLIHQGELFSRGQLSLAGEASETSQVVGVPLCSADPVIWMDVPATVSATRSIFPARKKSLIRTSIVKR